MVSSLSPSHLARYGDLARLLIKHGRSDVVRDIGWDGSLPSDAATAPGGAEPTEEALGLAADLERMGPTYVKLGQLLSTRVDLLPPAYVEALGRLQDDVEPVPFGDIEEVVTAELGVRLSRAFARFDERPMASASLGQVHRAELRSGRQVVVKVQRPGIRDRVRSDMEVLGELAGWLDRHTALGRRYGFGDLLEQFGRALSRELDYAREAENLRALAATLADHRRIVVPQPVADLTTSRVLTMDLVPGHKITDVSPVVLLDVDGAGLADELFSAYLKQVLVEGFFHADPHPGNVLLTPDGKLGLIDLGQVARVPTRLRDKLVRLLVAIGDGNGDEAANAAVAIGQVGQSFDEGAFRAEIADLVARNAALRLEQINAGSVLLRIAKSCGDCDLRPAPELAMLGKTLLNLDQVAHALDPEFEPVAAIRRHTGALMSAQMRPDLGSMLASAMEAKDFAVQLPGRVNRMMDALTKGEFELRVHAIDEAQLLRGLQKLANRLTMGLVIAALIVGAALLVKVPTDVRILGYPAIAIVCFLLAAAGGVALLASIWRADRQINRESRRQWRDGRG
ncbi:MAG: ABC1 kinase family protein [Frankiaceae bacterium]